MDSVTNRMSEWVTVQVPSRKTLDLRTRHPLGVQPPTRVTRTRVPPTLPVSMSGYLTAVSVIQEESGQSARESVMTTTRVKVVLSV